MRRILCTFHPLPLVGAPVMYVSRIHQYRTAFTTLVIFPRALETPPCSHNTNFPSSHYTSVLRPFHPYQLHWNLPLRYRLLLLLLYLLAVVKYLMQYKRAVPSDYGTDQKIVWITYHITPVSIKLPTCAIHIHSYRLFLLWSSFIFLDSLEWLHIFPFIMTVKSFPFACHPCISTSY